jgi:hypothetical protein
MSGLQLRTTVGAAAILVAVLVQLYLNTAQLASGTISLSILGLAGLAMIVVAVVADYLSEGRW